MSAGELLRRPLRRGVREALRHAPSPIRNLFARVPFSRLHAIPKRLFWGTESIEYHGAKIAVNPGDVLGYYAYFLNYADAEIAKLVEACGAAETFVDVGANFGWVSLAVAGLCPHLSVLAFEPGRDAVAGFRANLLRNPRLAPRIRLIEQAVGDADGLVSFIPSRHDENPGIGRIASSAESGPGYEVSCVRLDSYFGDLSGPDVVKIDVEGAELAVLRGMSGLFASRRPATILLETHAFYFGARAAEFNSDLLGELERAGFSITRLSGDRWVPVERPAELGARSHLLARRGPIDRS